MKTRFAIALAVLAGCNSPAPAPPPATTTPATTAVPAPTPTPDPCAADAPEKEERDAEFAPSTTCAVKSPAKYDCDRVKSGKAFKWKFKNSCGDTLYAIRVVDPAGNDLQGCNDLGSLDKNKSGDIKCMVKAASADHRLTYHIVWKTTSDGNDNVHDPILDIRKNP